MRNISRFSGCNLGLIYIALIPVSIKCSYFYKLDSMNVNTPIGFDSLNSYVTKYNTTLFPDSGRKLKSWVLALF